MPLFGPAMGLRPPSPAPSIDGFAQLRQYIDTGAATLFIEPNGLDTGVAQANAEDPSRYRAPNNAGSMASYNGFEKGAETLATMGYSHDNGWALHLGNRGQDGQTSLPSSNHYAAGAPFGAALGDSDQYNLVGLVSKRRLSSLLTVKQDKVPFTPESSPPVGDCGTTRRGVGLSTRLRAVPDATRARRPRAASKRRNQAGATRKSFFLRQPLSEISTESGDALVFDVDSFVHATGKNLSKNEREAMIAAVLKGMRWTYLGTGMTHPNFLATVEEISPEGKKQIDRMAPMFC